MCKINKLILLLIFTISSIIQVTNFNGICVGINDYPGHAPYNPKE